MKLSTYMRKEQHFQIFIRSRSGKWETYDPSVHGPADSISRNYVVAYANGEVIENRVNTNDLPPGTNYISVVPYKVVKMPQCVVDEPRVQIVHESSVYHQHGRYCTKMTNTGEIPFRVNRFAAFSKAGFFRGYRLSTISNDWFSHEQFMCWYNAKAEWLQPRSTVADQDNFGFGNGYWVFEIEFEGKETIRVKLRLPHNELKATR